MTTDATTARTELELLIGEPLNSPKLDTVLWGSHYPLTLNHRTVNAVISVDEFDTQTDAVILDQYVFRGIPNWTPFKQLHIESLAIDLENQANYHPNRWDATVWERLFTDGPLQQVDGYPTVASCVLALSLHEQFRRFVDEIAAEDGVTQLDVLNSVARTIHAALDADE